MLVSSPTILGHTNVLQMETLSGPFLIAGTVILFITTELGRRLFAREWNTRGILDSTASSPNSRERKHRLQRLCENNDGICLQDTQGKTEFLQALLVLHTQYHMVGKVVNDQFNTGSSAILVRKTLLHGDTVRTHVIAQMGQDHFVEIRSENRLLIIADVHLEPGSSLGNL